MGKRKHTVGKIIAVIQGLLSILVMGLLFKLNVLPTAYYIIAVVVLVLLFLFVYFTQVSSKTHVIGKIVAVLLSILLAIGSWYLLQTSNLIGNITGNEYKIDNIVAVVWVDDPAESLLDAADYTFGILETVDRDKVDESLTEFTEELNRELTYAAYGDFRSLVDAFLSGEVQALIYNQAWNDSIDEMEKNFSESVRILKTVEIKTEREVVESTKDVTVEPFIVYVSGNDQYGSISTTGRSDVNILAAVNPETKQILLVVTPRDYYIEFPGITNGQKDKLTHAGNFGITASMAALENVYNIKIDHYLRLNFTSFVQIVDALGGVEVESETAFTTIHGEYTITEGINKMNGEKALAFVRERYNLPGGDFTRGKNQQALLTAVIKKSMTPAILTGYLGILSGLENNLETSMSSEELSALVRFQLSYGGDWNIVSVAAGGTVSTEYCFSLGTSASVVIPDEASVAEIRQLFEQLKSGMIME